MINTDTWEQRKLGDVVEFLDTLRKPLEGAKRISGPYPYYGASGIVDYVNGYLFDKELVLLSEDGANITDRNYPVCFLASGKYWVNNHAHVLKTKDGNENNFICNSLERKDYKQYNSGMAMPKLNQEVCKGIPISCPTYDEQKQIGDYFRNLDHLITLHQRKLFLNFAKRNDWEQRKVSELFRVTRGYVLAATQTETTKTDEKPYPVYSSQTKDKGLMGYYKDYLYEDAITWTTDGANAGTVNYRAGKFYCTNVCGVLLSNEAKANQMIAEALNNVAKGYVSYVGNPKLMNNVMADIVIQIPTQAEEREQLSSLFASLDNLITLHRRAYYNKKGGLTNVHNDNQQHYAIL